MEQSDTPTIAETMVSEKDVQESREQSFAQPDRPQNPASEIHDGKIQKDDSAQDANQAESKSVNGDSTIQCVCGSSEDDRTLVCEKCEKRQHIACYYPDYEIDSFKERFRHICINCDYEVDTTEEEDEDSADEYELTAGFSEASTSASRSGEASTDGNNIPNVFLYMTQDVQNTPASGGYANDDTLRVSPVNVVVQELREQFFALLQIPLRWEDPERLDKALTVIPLDQIHDQAQKAEEQALLHRTEGLKLHSGLQSLDQDWGYNDFVIKELMNWFKHDFFTWVDINPACPVCSSPMKAQGEVQPTAEEKEESALVVELYMCWNQDCGSSKRFPRYGDPWRLLETRSGRLAEWANCFGMLCRAVGAQVRWVWNADKGHIWLEVYSKKKERWVSIDIFEAAWDKPLLYTEGKQSRHLTTPPPFPLPVQFILPRESCAAHSCLPLLGASNCLCLNC